MFLQKFFLATSLILATSVVQADLCVAPGDVVVTDPVGDVIGSPVPPDPVTNIADVVSLSVATPEAASIDEQTVVFTLATSGTAPALPPGSGFFASFVDPRQTIRGVRLEGNTSGGFTYYSYVAAANSDGVTSGRLIEDGSQTPAEGSYAGNVITITVKAKDIGLRNAGDTLSGFNGGSLVLVGVSGVASQANGIDNMPDDLNDRAVAMPVTYSPCKKSAEARAADIEDKSATNFGGALAPVLLLILFGLAGFRRR